MATLWEIMREPAGRLGFTTGLALGVTVVLVGKIRRIKLQHEQIQLLTQAAEAEPDPDGLGDVPPNGPDGLHRPQDPQEKG